MKATGIVRRFDEVGRFCIPKELRTELGWKKDDSIEFFKDGFTIVIKKYNKYCVFCGTDDMNMLKDFDGKPICHNCVNKIKYTQLPGCVSNL